MKKHKIISILIKKDNIEKIDICAKETNQSRNEFIANILLDYVKNKSEKKLSQ